MSTAHFRFYAELNDFLPAARRFREFEHRFELNPAIKDVIEGLGAPHTEVDLILVDGTSVDFEYRLQDGDRVSVYPVFESVDIASEVRVRPQPLRETRFICDANLGKLARYLRLLGFDTSYRRDADDADLADASREQGRVLLTRDVGVLKRSSVTHGYYVRADEPESQVIEVLVRFDLADGMTPFERCPECNGELHSVPKEEIQDRLEPGTRSSYEEFRRCDGCERVYWEGAHFKRLVALVERVRQAAAAAQIPAGGGDASGGGAPAPFNRK
jgi:uncharacterized protein with PIN domain